MIRLLLCDDSDGYRNAVRDVLSCDPELEVIGEASDGFAAVELATRLQPDVVVMDIGLPRVDGVEATRRIRRVAPKVRVLALTAHDASDLVVPMLAAGARGFCLKGGGFDELRHAVHATSAGTFLDERAVGNVIDEAVRLHAAEQRSGAAAASVRVDLETASARVRTTAGALVRSLVAAIAIRDGYTAGHTTRVSNAATLLGARVCPELQADPIVAYGYLLHDVGKLGIPDALLHKRTPLEPAERNFLERHVEFGLALLADVPDFDRAREIVACHHERWDGKGYPAGLTAHDIPITARLFSICDAYDAMTSTRPYRRALSRAQAREELALGAASQFDPEIVPEFLRLIETIDLCERTSDDATH